MKKPVKREHLLIIDGQEATDRDYKRIMNAPGPKSDPNERATKPLQTVSRPFSLLR